MHDEMPRVLLPFPLLAAALGCGLNVGGMPPLDGMADSGSRDPAAETIPADDVAPPFDDAGADPALPDDAAPPETPAVCGNGVVEAGEECETGASEPCDTTCGTAGTRFCLDCRWGACAPPPESCNGVDDDCNGLTDEGCASPVPNDRCAGAIDISGGGLFPGTTEGAAHDQDHCSISELCDPGGSDVFYRFTLSGPEVVFLSLQGGPAWDAVLTVRAGGCDGPMVGCSDDACENRLPQWAGHLDAGSYWVAIDGCDPDDFGAFTLRYAHAPCPGTEDPTTLLPSPGTYWDDSCGWGNDARSSCGGDDDDDVPMYFALCPGSHTVRASTCDDGEDWPSSLVIRTGGGGLCGGAEAACSGAIYGRSYCDDGRSWAQATITGPELVFVLLDGAGSGSHCGPFAVDVTF